MSISVFIAGSTAHTRQCANALAGDPRFHLSGILTPTPKIVGRKKILEENPLHKFATQNNIPTVLIDTKINQEVQNRILQKFEAPQILLVVDFGYIVPEWLLNWPTVAPVNVHPSDLPKYRGSSPGQFALLNGEKHSAVTIMRMDRELDHGPLINKIDFEIMPAWSATGYYSHAFALVEKSLGDILAVFLDNPTAIKDQPDVSPTPTARMLTREDGFIPFEALNDLLNMDKSEISIPLLKEYELETTPVNLQNMWKALNPWPGIWTKSVRRGKEDRVKILELTLIRGKLSIKKVQFEGKNPRDYEPGII